MSGHRVVFVTRRFWPDWNGASRAIGSIAMALVEQGNKAKVLTPQPCAHWPAHCTWHGVSMERLPAHKMSHWHETSYLRNLKHWFRDHRDQYDLVCISGLRRAAQVVIESVDSNGPVVLRAETAGRLGDCLWQLDVRDGRKIKRSTTKAAAWIGTHRLAHQELIAAGYPRERIHYISHGTAPRDAHDQRAQTIARRSLAADHPTLMLAEKTPLAVFVGRIEPGRGLTGLITAWEKVVARHPKARLWLAGHGPHHSALQQRINSLGLGGSIALVGQFVEVDTLLAAADLFVLPSKEANLSAALLEAMAAGLPAVVCNNAANREVVEHEQRGLLVPSDDTDALADALDRLIREENFAQHLGTAARDHIEQHFSLAKMVQSHVTLFEELW